ncbi:hypothetical protein FOMPIDRAFT_52962 [Fomitopsis schrenkii]|uniref:BTB domain-containing protein n=1 Tax=Fomitopsis schrenkii TaxID=2126942 RepID=S8F4I6_FOMSC|nr:hypothetical protein FOMPIDRAFT_52962 [Fomitopsis schrenkii]
MSSPTIPTQNVPFGRHGRFYFDDGNVIFLVRLLGCFALDGSRLTRVSLQVENTLFNVHRYFLKRESSVFRDMFMSTPDSDAPEGSSDEHPIVLEGTSSLGFSSLLTCFYPRSAGKVENLSADQWASVVDLSIRWEFSDVKDLAITKMQTDDRHYSATLAIQVATAHRHNLDEWYWSTFLKMCERGPPVSPKEAEQLGRSILPAF